MIRLFAALALASNLSAGGFEAFDSEIFSSLQAQERTILVHFHSVGCSICKEQAKVLRAIVETSGNYSPEGLQVEYDTAGELRRRYGVTAPSTILIFKGDRLIGRSVGKFAFEEVRDFIRESRTQARGRPSRRAKRTYLPKR